MKSERVETEYKEFVFRCGDPNCKRFLKPLSKEGICEDN